MALTEKQKYELKKFIKELELHRGRHTELVSVYIPAGYDMNKIINHLSQEQGTATNIKSASTRKNVITALEKMIQHLRLFKQTPSHGLAVFSGNVSKREGQEDFKVWSIEPPVPLKTRIYRCDKEFVLDLLRAMLEVKEAYGLVVIDRRDANIALLRGKTIIPLTKTHSEVPGKFRAGGQSAQRFHRIIEGAAKDHYRKVADYMKEQFLGLKGLKGIIVGGPGPTKHDFIELGNITSELKKKIIAVKDLSYTGDFGLQELVDKSQDVLAQEEIAAEKKIMAKFFDILSKKPGMVSYGEQEVMKNLKLGAVDTLLLSEDLEDEKIEEFEKEANVVGTTVNIISTETREGVQLRDIGKVAAILRYEVQ
ncbi:peptide chain release factor aRF-1 [Candidatus Woesearchaeota archaeon]|nr:peptide chain release factor aRF-1 [Candidatus Woesearchaeota archaeon]